MRVLEHAARVVVQVLSFGVGHMAKLAAVHQGVPLVEIARMPTLLGELVHFALTLLCHDDAPALLHAVRGRNLGVDMLARFQRLRRHRPLMLAADDQRNRIDPVVICEFRVVLKAGNTIGIRHRFKPGIKRFLTQITKGGDAIAL